jgi:hypothetical protein
VNKPINLHYFYPYIHIFYFLFFCFFYFFNWAGPGPAQHIFWGWAQRSPLGLVWAQPARPGHWPKPVTGWAKTDEVRVEWLPACFMHSAKVINLPSHSATIQSN